MRNLIVISHPDPNSLTHAAAGEMVRGLLSAGPDASVVIADLAAEGFDPRETAQDLAVHLGAAAFPQDVATEHARIDRADRLILVYPVYWWSFPALLKGWIDRVFANGWAYASDAMGGGSKKMLGRLEVVLVAVAGANAETYARHGYFGAMRTQIDHGIFDYCGARVVRHELLLDSHGADQQPNLDAARRLGEALTIRRAA